MGTTVSRWGNSLAVRLPKAVVEALGLAEGDDVTVTSEGGAIVMRPTHEIDLDTLLERITRENLPDRDEWPAVGRELL